MRLNPHLSFDGQCEAAFGFYEKCLGGKIHLMLTYEDSPLAQQTPRAWGKNILHATLAFGEQVLTGADVMEGYQKPRGFSIILEIGEAAEADHSRAARVLLTEQSRRSLVVWITDFAETPTTPEVIEYAMQMTQRHLVVFAAMNQPDLTTLAETAPKNREEMYRHAAALEIAQRRDLLLRGLRQRGVFAFELVPGLLASSLVNQYLDIKERNLL